MPITPPSAGAFRSVVEAFAQLRLPLPEAAPSAAETAQRLRRDLRAAIHQHVGDTHWRALLHRMREVAEDGAHEYRLLRLPEDDTTDSGRAIREQEPGWPATLTGEAADLYRHWEQELHPHGFGITARVLDYAGGLPGDIGLFVTWS